MESNGLIADLGQWWEKPFDSQGSVTNWFLFLGLLILLTFVWSIILKGLLVVVETAAA